MPPSPSILLSPQDAQDDLTHLAREIGRRYSYFALRRDAFAEALNTALSAAHQPLSAGELGAELSKALAALDDGHAGVEGAPDAFLPGPFAPCLFGPVAGGLVAFREDRSGFVDDGCPYVRSIDGDDVGDWLAAARSFVPADTERVGNLRAAKLLRFTAALRSTLMLPAGGDLRLELQNQDGTLTRTVVLPLSARKPLYRRALDPSPLVPPGVGYLRLERCDDAAHATVHEAMRAAQGSRGLIIDLRDNGGGSRRIVKTLLPYLMSPDEPPAIVTAAVYRLQPRDAPGAVDGYLEDRFMYPVDWSGWTAAEKTAIDRWLVRFAPRWVPPADQGFSPLHVMAVSRSRETPSWYRQPVVVLVNEGCYSATEILLCALKGRPGTTLMGVGSGGGSGRPRGFGLLRSRLRVRASTMVAYRPDGALLQGNGVDPDQVCERLPSDWLRGPDRLLERAVEALPA